MKYTIDIPIRFSWPDPEDQPPTYRLFVSQHVLSCPAPLMTIRQLYGLIGQLRRDMLSHLEQTGRRISQINDKLPSQNLKSMLSELSAQLAEIKRGPISRVSLSEAKDMSALMGRLNKIEARLSGLEKMVQLGHNE